jgi:multiple antibiotic resistance protein
MDHLSLSEAFVTFLALLGPQKVLLSVTRIARTREVRSVRLVAWYAALSAALIGVVCALAAPWMALFFHITTASVELSAGVVFFVYALGLVFGVHLGEEAEPQPTPTRTGTPTPAGADAAPSGVRGVAPREKPENGKLGAAQQT